MDQINRLISNLFSSPSSSSSNQQLVEEEEQQQDSNNNNIPFYNRGYEPEEEETEEEEIEQITTRYLSHPKEIQTLKHTLQESTPFPLEIVNEIMEKGEFWACKQSERNQPFGGQNLNLPYLTLDFNQEEIDSFFFSKKLVKLEFECKAHDQGWSTNEGSWTWAELSLAPREIQDPDQLIVFSEANKNNQQSGLFNITATNTTATYHNDNNDYPTNHPPSAPNNPFQHIEVYRNPPAESEFTYHQVTYHQDSPILQNFNPLQHQLVLWVRAMYPGWSHYIKEAKIRAYYQVK